MATMHRPETLVGGGTQLYAGGNTPAAPEIAALTNKELRARARDLGGSKDQLEAVAESDEPREATRALEVSLSVPNKELCARAVGLNATDEQLEEVLDDDNPRQALMALVDALEDRSRGGAEPPLTTLSNRMLRGRASEFGATAEQLAEVLSNDDPREFLLALVAALLAAPRGVPVDLRLVYNPAELAQQVDRPDVIISYRTKTDAGRGAAHMWAVLNLLAAHGVSGYCGLMVRTDNWQEKWFGKMGTAKCAIIMTSDTYWEPRSPCTDEGVAILQEGIKIFSLRFDESASTCMRGTFLGESEDQIDRAGFCPRPPGAVKRP
jgi:hypothetical protein